MAATGWKQLLAGAPWFGVPGRYPLAAYSEFMPPPRLGRKAYRHARPDPLLFHPDDPHGWHVTEYEEALELRPGLEGVAACVLKHLMHLGRGEPGSLARAKL